MAEITSEIQHKYLKNYLVASTLNTGLHFASEYGRVSLVRGLLENGADPNAANRNGFTCLEYGGCMVVASGNRFSEDHRKAYELLIIHGANAIRKDLMRDYLDGHYRELMKSQERIDTFEALAAFCEETTAENQIIFK
jgi:hypothetical protein